MEISLREWLIIGGIVVIALILFDGWRRIRASRNNLRIDIDKSLSDIADNNHHNPELPNGGARVRYDENPSDVVDTSPSFPPPAASPPPQQDETVDAAELPSLMLDQIGSAKVDNDEDVFDQPIPVQEEYKRSLRDTSSLSKPPVSDRDSSSDLQWTPDLESQFEQLEPLESINSIEPEESAEPKGDKSFDQMEEAAEEVTPVEKRADFSDLDPLFDDIPTDYFDPAQSDKQSSAMTESTKDEPNLYLDLDLDQPIHQIMANKAVETASAGKQEKKRKTPAKEKSFSRDDYNPSLTLPLDDPPEDLFAMDQPVDEPITEPLEEVGSKKSAKRKAMTDLPDPEDVLVITVVGKNKQLLEGVQLQRIVEACGMEHGDMSIYHRFDGEGKAASLQFSMANAVNPGTFNPDDMESLETPAVSFFMSMKEPRDPMTAYECMLATAETLAKHLQGDLLDEDRSVMREQTKEHYRQRIRDFEMQSRRRNLSR